MARLLGVVCWAVGGTARVARGLCPPLVLGTVAAALVFAVAVQIADAAAPARADAKVTRRYTLAITVRIHRLADAYLPGGETSGHWDQETTWKAAGRYPFSITRIGSGAGADYRFVARITGRLTAHRGTGRALVRLPQRECWVPEKDVAPTSAQLAGTVSSVGTQLQKLKSGKLQRQLELSFMRRQPVGEPEIAVSLAATPCNPATVVPGQSTLPVPPSWRGTVAAAKIRFGRAFTVKLGFDTKTTPSLYEDVPGGHVATAVTWTLRFKPAPAA